MKYTVYSNKIYGEQCPQSPNLLFMGSPSSETSHRRVQQRDSENTRRTAHGSSRRRQVRALLGADWSILSASLLLRRRLAPDSLPFSPSPSNKKHRTMTESFEEYNNFSDGQDFSENMDTGAVNGDSKTTGEKINASKNDDDDRYGSFLLPHQRGLELSPF